VWWPIVEIGNFWAKNSPSFAGGEATYLLTLNLKLRKHDAEIRVIFETTKYFVQKKTRRASLQAPLNINL
jgi:hypothetical protein